MLSEFDELLIHQIPQTFGQLANSDRRCFDRYFFGAFSADGKVAIAAGIGQYANTGVADGFGAVIVGGHQHNVRVSRPLWPQFGASSVGPLRVEILEPLRVLRYVLEPNAAGFGFELVFEGDAAPWQERHHSLRRKGRLIEDQERYVQIGRCSGTVHLKNETFSLSKAGTFAIRDHAWGLRPGIGGPEPGEDPYGTGYGAAHWIQFRIGSRAGYVRLTEDPQGNAVGMSGLVTEVGSTPAHRQSVRSFRHALDFHKGSRRIRGGMIELSVGDAKPWALQVKDVITPLNEHGCGYQGGWADAQGHGVARGDGVHLEHDVWDARKATRIVNLGPTETIPQNKLFDNLLQLVDSETGEKGHAWYVFFSRGEFLPYGFRREE